MAQTRERPILTNVYETLAEFVPDENSCYLFGTSPEERSAHSLEWETRARNVRFIRIVDQNVDDFTVQIGEQTSRVPLRSERQLNALLNSLNARVLYLDITGLSHHVWAPLLRTALFTLPTVIGVYVEPGDYRFSATPTEGEIFDLSERIVGISPIPGFAALTEPEDDAVCFVPLLGFEGTRFAYLIEQVQPPGGKIVPVVGIPGFRIEYPFYTYHGNQPPLKETQAWRNVRFARANCPFSLFYLLQDIARDYPQDLLKIAPIGTKPHALGAVLFHLKSGRRVEIVYDHPIRKATRTSGAARALVYHLSKLPGASPA